MDREARIVKTLVCVAIAGVLFIAAVYYGYKLLFIPAAFFDWLPLPTGWMKLGGGPRTRKAGALHGVVTAIAYVVGVLWLLIGSIGGFNLGFIFLEIWFIAVLLGAYTTAIALVEGA